MVVAADMEVSCPDIPRILVVDDEPDLEALVTQRFRRRIRSGELDFVFARDGQHALDVLDRTDDIDMVLSDINMPRMDGLTLLDKIRERQSDVRTVIVSAYGDMANIRLAMNRGAFDFLTKPIEFEDLELTIDKTLDDVSRQRDMQREKQAAEQSKQAMARYFSPSVVHQLEADPQAMEASGDKRFVTLLFSDLTDFTPLVETTDPDVLVPLLNAYLEGLTRIIFEHDGTVMKIIGDAVRAIFGAPVDQPDHATKAVECALAADKFAREFQAARIAEGIALGNTRFGINSGHVIVGNFGGSEFFEYTAYGDAINGTSRLESVNKRLGTRICVGQPTVQEIKNFRGRPVGEMILKGKMEPLEVSEPLTREAFEKPATEAYLRAYRKMLEGDSGAGQAFAAYVGEYGEDPVAMFHLQRLLTGERGTKIRLED